MALQWQTPRTFNVNETEVASYLNAVRDALTFLGNPPIAQLVQATTQSVSNSGWTAVTFDSTVADSYGGHSNTTNNSRYTSQAAGWYQVTGTVCWTANATGSRGVRIEKNGAIVQGAISFTGTNTVPDIWIVPTATFLIYLNAGDYIEVYGFQNSGGALSTIIHPDATASLNALWAHA